jgi:hypothetical protein
MLGLAPRLFETREAGSPSGRQWGPRGDKEGWLVCIATSQAGKEGVYFTYQWLGAAARRTGPSGRSARAQCERWDPCCRDATCAAGGVQRGEQRRRGAVESAETVKCGRPTLILTARQSRKDGESWR